MRQFRTNLRVCPSVSRGGHAPRRLSGRLDSGYGRWHAFEDSQEAPMIDERTKNVRKVARLLAVDDGDVLQLLDDGRLAGVLGV